MLVVGGGAGSYAHNSADVAAQVVGPRVVGGSRGCRNFEVDVEVASFASSARNASAVLAGDVPVPAPLRRLASFGECLQQVERRAREVDVWRCEVAVLVELIFFLRGVPHKPPDVAVDTHTQEVTLSSSGRRTATLLRRCTFALQLDVDLQLPGIWRQLLLLVRGWRVVASSEVRKRTIHMLIEVKVVILPRV